MFYFKVDDNGDWQVNNPGFVALHEHVKIYMCVNYECFYNKYSTVEIQ